MYQYYTGIADSVGNLSSNTYQYATDVQEVRRYLKGVTGEDISLENLYLTPDGKIGGLPGKAADLINKTKDNAKIERIKDALINIIGHNRISGDLGIPDFTSEFQFSNGAFAVADSGFTVDMAALDRRLTDVYKRQPYKFATSGNRSALTLAGLVPSAGLSARPCLLYTSRCV